MDKLLVVEDDKGLGYILTEYLRLHAYEVTWCIDGEQAIKSLQESEVNLCLVDVSLPQIYGFDLAKRIKQKFPLIPLIFLTARSLRVDKLKGFSVGADDNLIKQVDEEELLARIKAVLTRYRTQFSQQVHSGPATCPIGKFQLDINSQELSSTAGIQKLTKRETELLAYLIQNKNRLVEKKALLHAFWGQADYFNRRSMDVHLSKLRKYLSTDAALQTENLHKKVLY